MKKYLLALMVPALGLNLLAQSPRVSLYEEFTGETCGPCASTNPGLNTVLLSSTNAPRIVAIKWQVPIPSAPTKTWSLYQTNKTEIDWRWKSVTAGGYGYIPVINSAPSGKIDGRDPSVFGATSAHPTYLKDPIIAKAVSEPSAFNIVINRDQITTTSTAAVVSVTIQATAPYSTSSNLVFRTVLVERLIQFTIQPGSNGETKFEDVARKSYPTLQAGTTLPKTWTPGQTQTFTMNCVFPSYIHDVMEIEFVGFIQNDGTQRVEQVARTNMPKQSFDAAAASVSPPFLCSAANTMAPTVPVKNDGTTDITALTITPYVDGVAKATTSWTGLIKPGFSDFIPLNAFSAGTGSGSHTFSYTISGLNGTDANPANNGASGTFYGVDSYQAAPIAEGFSTGGWPYSKWLVTNADQGAGSWIYTPNVEAYGIGSGNCLKYNYFKNTVLNDVDELLLPPIDLTGVGVPVISFDIAYFLKTSTSNDKLELWVSDDCGAHWTSMWSATGQNSLATNQAPDTGEQNNPATNDWSTFMVGLYGFNKPNVLVKFAATNKNGNNLFLDNINLAASTIPDGLAENTGDKLNLGVYPNPNSGLTNVLINSTKNQDAKIRVVNSIGQVVLEKTVNLNVGSNTTTIDLSTYATGIYVINVEGANVKSASRVSISR